MPRLILFRKNRNLAKGRSAPRSACKRLWMSDDCARKRIAQTLIGLSPTPFWSPIHQDTDDPLVRGQKQQTSL